VKRNLPSGTPAAGGRAKGPRRPLRFLLRSLGVLAIACLVLAGSLYGAYRWVSRDLVVVPIPISPTVDVDDGSFDDVPLPDEITPDSTPTGPALPTPIDGLGEWDLRRLRAHYTVPIEYRAQKDPLVENFLLLASDRRFADSLGNTDTILVVSLDRRHGLVKMTSVLRDIKLAIPGRTLENKINVAYALGGPGLVINTLNDDLDLDIQRYVLIDKPSMVLLVERVGGVVVYVDEAERAALRLDATGRIRLDGKQALAYAALREIDSDEARTGRQREILAAVLQAFRDAPPSRQVEWMSAALSMIETNLGQDEILARAAQTLPGLRGMRNSVIPQPGTFETVHDAFAGDWFTVDWPAAAAGLKTFLASP